MAELSPIANFYHNRTVFITGATGFLGKVLVEKLLRSCHRIQKIYILVRAKRGKSPQQRLESYLTTPIFDLVRIEATKKIRIVEGDITQPLLGIKEEDLSVMSREVSVAFHCAATVRFQESLKQALHLNVLGTRYMMDVCRKFEKLESLVHVSTAYTNCVRSTINEAVYPSTVPYQKVLDLLGWMESDMLDSVAERLVGDHPNTYTFTKLLAENLVQAECGMLPVAIVRPCIVASTWREPIPGYVDSLSGVNGIISAGSTGMLRTMYVLEEKAADVIPADVAINVLIAVSWYTAVHRPNSLMVYNCTPSTDLRVTWGSILKAVIPLYYEYPHHKIFRCPSGTFQRSPSMNLFYHYIDHLIPAFLTDAAAVLMGRKPVMIKLYQKIVRTADSLSYFSTQQWIFKKENSALVLAKMTEQDKKVFYLDVDGIKWLEFWKSNVIGNRKYIFKEDLSTLPSARRSLTRRYWLTQLSKYILMFSLVYRLIGRHPQLKSRTLSLLTQQLGFMSRS